MRIYLTQSDSQRALAFMRVFREPLPFTPLHRHELRNALRLAVFRKEIDTARRQEAFADIESDLDEGILTHVPIAWTNAFREAEQLGEDHTEKLGVRGMDLLHVGVSQVLGVKRFLTFDSRQADLARAAGLDVKW
jgi:predicted nucleic acid-binding protein